MELKDFDVIFVNKAFKGNLYNWIMPPLIQLFQGGKYHHCDYYFKGRVYGSTAKGWIDQGTLDEYLEKNKRYKLLYARCEDFDFQKAYDRHMFGVGKPYWFWGLLFASAYQEGIERLTGKEGTWLGAKKGKKRDAFYCSSAIAYLFGFEKDYTFSPKDLLNKLKEI